MSNTQTAPTAPQAPTASQVQTAPAATKPGIYTRFAAQTDRRITRVGRHALVGVAGGGAAAGLAHYGVAGLSLSPTTVGVGVGVGVGVSLLGDLVLIDADEYTACRLKLDYQEVEKLKGDIKKSGAKRQERIASILATM